MGLKKFFVLGIILALFSISLVSSIACSDDRQRIMRLYREKNSHGALWNESEATLEVCFDSAILFGYPSVRIEGADDPRNCNNKNQIIKLNYNTNSHAEIFELNNYDVKVCFGNLKCNRTVGNCDESVVSCPANPTVVTVLSLSGETNSHISLGNDTDFPIKICCCDLNPRRNEAYWTDMNDNTIGRADLKDRVKLVLTKKILMEAGYKVNFTIYKRGVGGVDILWYSEEIVAQSPDRAFTTWRAGMKYDGTFEFGTYYFIATGIRGLAEQSTDLIVGIESNSKPVAKIVLPVMGSVYLKSTNIDYKQTSYDLDDYMNYSWVFDDGTIVKGRTDNYVNYNTTHKYQTKGWKVTNLNVIDDRGLTDSDTTAITVIDTSADGIYVAALVNDPKPRADINDNPHLFKGEDSYAIKYIKNSVPVICPTGDCIICLGGKCPEWTSDPVPKQITDPNNKRGDYSDLKFKWSFDDGEIIERQGGGITNGQAVRKTYATNGWKWLILEVFYAPGGINSGDKASSGKIEFRLIERGCSADGKKWIDYYGKIWSTTATGNDANDKCKMEDNDDNTNCCPSGMECKEDTNGKYSCQVDDFCELNDIDSCEKYSETNCNDDPCNVGKGVGCGIYTVNICDVSSQGIRPEAKCRCEWNGTQCIKKGEMAISLFNGNVNLDSTCESAGIQAGECIDGIMKITENNRVVWDPNQLIELRDFLIGLPPDDPLEDTPLLWLEDHCDLNSICLQGTKDVICGIEGVRLRFFTWINLIISVLVITIIYVVLVSWKRMKKIKGKKK